MVGDSPNIAKSYIWNVEIMFLQIVDMLKKTPTYNNKMKAFGLEHRQARTNKKKGSKNKIWLVLFEFHMMKKMPPKGRVLAFMMNFQWEIFFRVGFVKCIEFNFAMVSYYLESVQ